LPSDPKEVAGYLKARLNRGYDLFLQTAPGNSYASVDEDGWCLSVDTPEKPGKEADAKLDRLKSWLMHGPVTSSFIGARKTGSRWTQFGRST
jgi:hypothetical protein